MLETAVAYETTTSLPRQWGRFNVPDPLSVLDSLLAATASAHGLALVTRNVKDVERNRRSLSEPFQRLTTKLCGC